LPILTPKLVATATFFDQSKDQSITKYLFGENLMKIGLMDLEIISLQEIILKIRKKLAHAEHMAHRACIPCVLNNNNNNNNKSSK